MIIGSLLVLCLSLNLVLVCKNPGSRKIQKLYSENRKIKVMELLESNSHQMICFKCISVTDEYTKHCH